ncbi:MAG: FdtA/QdtA family cupin domain-containing protein [Bacteroidota bacterium]|nr:FdtA/QdtA family cupin domain-containing protein [Candidatus Kapabacteria bacterium]MDW8219578.1 FdtA/QdtA family cupin domain-containing protein [Bacteroidota bacterium]
MSTKRASIRDCKVFDLPRIFYREGNLTPINGGIDIPFEIKRTFYIYDIPGGESRGAHAHRECHQFIVCMIGGFDVAIDDGINRDTIHLNRSYKGLYIPPMIWASEINFTAGSVCAVFASHLYDESDYIRDYKTFLRAVQSPLLYNSLDAA